MDFMGTILKGIVGIIAIMVGVYLLANYGGAVSDNAIPHLLCLQIRWSSFAI